MAWQDLLDGIGSNSDSEDSDSSDFSAGPGKKRKRIVTVPTTTTPSPSPSTSGSLPAPVQKQTLSVPLPKRTDLSKVDYTPGTAINTSDSELRGLRYKLGVADDMLASSASNLQDIQQQKADYANAPVKQVPAWKRVLYGALENIGKQNPKSDWGTILGAGAAGAVSEGASQNAFANRVTKNRTAEAEEIYAPKIKNAEEQMKTSSIIANIASQKQKEYEAQVAADTAERHRQQEFDLRSKQEERLGRYQAGMLEARKDTVANTAENQKNLQKFRDAELQLKKDAQENTKTYHQDSLAQQAKLAADKLANQNVQYTKIQVPNRKADGTIEYVDVPVPTNVEDVHEYLKGLYGETSPITRAVKPGGKVAPVRKSVSNQANNQNKFRFGGQ